MSRAQLAEFRHLDTLTESLERRQLLAGNVMAFVDGVDQIIVRGDTLDNVAAVESDADGLIWLRGAKGTAINGADQPLLIGSHGELTRNIRIDLRGGDDQLAFSDVALIGKVDLQTGAGDDLVLVNEVFAFSEHRIDLGIGADRFGAANTVMQHDLLVLGRGGDDFAQLTSVIAIRDVHIQMHGGNDEFHADDATIGGNLEIHDVGAGADLVELTRTNVRESLRVSTVSGDDTVRIRDEFRDLLLDELIIQTGAGNDYVDLSNTYVNQAAFQIITGSGADQLRMSRVSGNALAVDLQGGADQADLYLLYIYDTAGLRFTLGSGDDQLLSSHLDLSSDFNGVGVPPNVIFDGGSGDDRMWFQEGQAYLYFGEGQNAPMHVVAGTGNDLVAFVERDSAVQNVDLGAGSDQLLIVNSGGDDDWSIFAGSGNDMVLIGDFRSTRLSVATGNGRDTLAVGSPGDDGFFINSFQAHMGNQDDTLYLFEDLPLTGSIEGGAGFDTFQEDLSLLVHLQPTSFEEILPDQQIDAVWNDLVAGFLTAWSVAGVPNP